jgi:hypothetical protein
VGRHARPLRAHSACFGRFQTWVKAGTLQSVLQLLADDLVARAKLDRIETFIDGTHAGAKNRDVARASPEGSDLTCH